ncbi:terminase small subunit [Acetivibrio straminisolvens]|jgi:phage terminase small subunit|uniref:terminase small subunit n=1 Tax=Acetivibrio straminisolvens TaxID=253314 RepID=UPI00223F1AD0|nr:terminase small subunit [Acetivibrio straminisolvens]
MIKHANNKAIFKVGGGVKGLTAKQEKFVQELIKGKSQREAYKAAYNAKNMSNNSIDREACLLLKNPKVAQRYEELKSKVIKRSEEKAIITAEEIIKEIADIAKDDIKNYLSYRTEKQIVDYREDGEPVFGYRTVIELKNSDDVNTKNIKEISMSKDGTFKFKTYCRDTALYKLAEIFGLNKIQQDKQKLAEERFKHEKEIDSKKYW